MFFFFYLTLEIWTVKSHYFPYKMLHWFHSVEHFCWGNSEFSLNLGDFHCFRFRVYGFVIPSISVEPEPIGTQNYLSLRSFCFVLVILAKSLSNEIFNWGKTNNQKYPSKLLSSINQSQFAEVFCSTRNSSTSFRAEDPVRRNSCSFAPVNTRGIDSSPSWWN